MSEKEEERERKEKIEKLKEEKRQMEEELDDLKGNTKKGKAVCALVGILAVVLLLGGITVLIKTDAGGQHSAKTFAEKDSKRAGRTTGGIPAGSIPAE